MKRLFKKKSALTLFEVMAAMVVVVILAILFVPRIDDRGTTGYMMTSLLANARSLYTATSMMSLESVTTEKGDSSGDNMHWTTMHSHGKAVPTTLAMYLNTLVADNYLSVADLRKLLTGPGVVLSGDTFTTDNIAFKFFQVDDFSPSDQPLIITANWQGDQLSGNPYDNKGFVYFTKGGDGGMKPRPSDLTSTNIFPKSRNGKVYNYNTLK